jgi:hypothetical protein
LFGFVDNSDVGVAGFVQPAPVNNKIAMADIPK